MGAQVVVVLPDYEIAAGVEDRLNGWTGPDGVVSEARRWTSSPLLPFPPRADAET
jgi:hypothetical protein